MLPRGLGQRVEGLVGYPTPSTMLWAQGMPWVCLREQEKGAANPETPLHPPKSASTLHEWLMLLHVSVAMGNTAT